MIEECASYALGWTVEGGSIANKKAKEVSSVLMCPPSLCLLPQPKNTCLLEIFVVISCYL